MTLAGTDYRTTPATDETVWAVQGRRSSGAAGFHNPSTRRGTRRHQIDAALAEWGYTIYDALNGDVH